MGDAEVRTHHMQLWVLEFRIKSGLFAAAHLLLLKEEGVPSLAYRASSKRVVAVCIAYSLEKCAIVLHERSYAVTETGSAFD
ncbi:predicted protein [Sclerotinia sclerotiorum 1980 UF-70]|uniref:Uncharacterized protein n=2 Tax=Sclerotinia sclerotiorum (strain ATCC 18683 / 1980 / Ss-1) TaxID=665079 RepID=A7EWL6_SCLS1|nr:predicted protein [Sclerotinia sclerotiorum 1980 UF-70]APA05324.1 hypothetical protein sscle_01g000940 [Sclerotinia sclerotiorum 1980 UF-70]EDN93858.1 predicted protein [Sclerotinia sclerotiorum 1980 UF-70]